MRRNVIVCRRTIHFCSHWHVPLASCVFVLLSLFLSRCIVVLSWRSLGFFSSILSHTLTFLFIRTEFVMREWVWAFIFIMYWGKFGCCFLLFCSFFNLLSPSLAFFFYRISFVSHVHILSHGLGFTDGIRIVQHWTITCPAHLDRKELTGITCNWPQFCFRCWDFRNISKTDWCKLKNSSPNYEISVIICIPSNRGCSLHGYGDVWKNYISKHLHSLTKHLCSPKNLCVLLQNICALP